MNPASVAAINPPTGVALPISLRRGDRQPLGLVNPLLYAAGAGPDAAARNASEDGRLTAQVCNNLSHKDLDLADDEDED